MSKVYLIFRTLLFRDAVSAILQTHCAIRLVGAAEGITQAMEEILAQKPDVIFLEQTDEETPSGLSALLQTPTPPSLILLRLDGDGIQIWSPTRYESVHAKDLVDVVLARTDPERLSGASSKQSE